MLKRPVAWCLLLLAGGMWAPAPAMAHKLNVFAYVEGKTIHGEAYFRGRAPVRDAKVTVIGPAAEKLGETTTDADGKFALQVTVRCDHRLVVDAGEGHGAEYTVGAGELPADLPAPGAPPAQAGAAASIGPIASPAATAGPAAAAPSAASAAPAQRPAEAAPALPAEQPAPAAAAQEYRAAMEALCKQIALLRKELDEFKNETRMHDILGGIGYIFGIMGLAFYFLGVRRKLPG